MTKADLTTHKIAQNGIVAAIYFVLCIALPFISYGQIQFRVAELLVLLCFWRPDFIIGVTIGCFLANINSSLGPWDMLIGTAATFFSCLLVSYASPRMAVACIYPIAINAFVVGAELTWLADCEFWPSVGYVAVGEATVIVVSYILWLALSKNKAFMGVIAPMRHGDVRW
jgi:uncharacterized membrane protein